LYSSYDCGHTFEACRKTDHPLESTKTKNVSKVWELLNMHTRQNNSQFSMSVSLPNALEQLNLGGTQLYLSLASSRTMYRSCPFPHTCANDHIETRQTHHFSFWPSACSLAANFWSCSQSGSYRLCPCGCSNNRGIISSVLGQQCHGIPKTLQPLALRSLKSTDDQQHCTCLVNFLYNPCCLSSQASADKSCHCLIL